MEKIVLETLDGYLKELPYQEDRGAAPHFGLRFARERFPRLGR